jgi:hypothetical protein
MISMRQWLRTSRFLLFILLGMSLFWESCDNPVKQANKEDIALDTLPDQLSDSAGILIKNFQSADDNLASDFFFGGIESNEDKAICFRLNSNQTKAFFEELDQQKASAAPSDSIRIRIHMALFGKEGTKRSGKPNLTLLLDILKNGTDSALSDYVYPLRPFLQVGDRIISNKLADSLTTNWEKIPVENLAKQLYLNGDATNATNRIQYYTFNAKDTQDIYAYRKQNPGCGMFVYLGQLVEKDHVPLRVIIRLTKNLQTKPTEKNVLDGNGDNYEFATPCPNHCI